MLFGIALRSGKAESSRDNSSILFELLALLVDKPIVCFLDATRQLTCRFTVFLSYFLCPFLPSYHGTNKKLQGKHARCILTHMHFYNHTYIVPVHMHVSHFPTSARSQKTIKIKRLSVLTCKTHKKRKNPVEQIIKNNNGSDKKLKLIGLIQQRHEHSNAMQSALPDVKEKDHVLN